MLNQPIFEGDPIDEFIKEEQWAILLTKKEIRSIRICLELGLYKFRASCETSINDRESIERIIKTFGRIA